MEQKLLLCTSHPRTPLSHKDAHLILFWIVQILAKWQSITIWSMTFYVWLFCHVGVLCLCHCLSCYGLMHHACNSSLLFISAHAIAPTFICFPCNLLLVFLMVFLMIILMVFLIVFLRVYSYCIYFGIYHITIPYL